jgi:hypothetical protein
MEYVGNLSKVKGKTRVTFRDIYRHFNRSKKAVSIMESLKDDSETELESRRRLAKKKLKDLVYGRDGIKYRNLIKKIREESSSKLSYVNEIRNNIELKSYLQSIIDNITLLLSSKLQLNRRIIGLEKKMSKVVREYVERTKLDDLTYNKILRLFSQPTDYGCPARIKIERPQDRWNIEERVKSIKKEKDTIQIEIQNILRRKYREIKDVDEELQRYLNINEHQESEEPEDEEIVNDSMFIVSPHDSLEEIVKDPIVQELVNNINQI